MTQHMDANEVVSIGMHGAGDVILGSRNKRMARCAVCQKELATGEGYRFRTVHYSVRKGGFWCHACVGNFLNERPNWMFNPMMGILFPIDYGNLPREMLAEAWNGGKEKLYHAITVARAKSVGSYG